MLFKHIRITTMVISCLFLSLLIINDRASGIENVSDSENGNIDISIESNIAEKEYIISQIKFDGNRHFRINKLVSFFGWIKDKEYTVSNINNGINRIIEGYKKDGYIFVEVKLDIIQNTSDKNLSILVIQLNEGKKLRIGNLTISGNELFTKSIILRHLGLKQGDYFAQKVLEKGIERLQLLYSEHGYPLIEIETDRIDLSKENGSIDLSLSIREGNKVRLAELKISGLKKTKQNVVLREIPLKKDDVYNQRKIDQTYHNLRNIGFFHSIQPNIIDEAREEDKFIIHPKVVEARTGRLIGVLGYAPPLEGSDELPQLTGIVEIQETNLLGTGRVANFFWKSGLLKSLSLGYKEPWVFGRPFSLGLSYNQLEQFNRRNELESEEKAANISADTSLGSFYEGEIILGYKRINFSGYPLQSSNYLSDRTSNTLGSTLFENNSKTPVNGSKYSLTLRLTRDSRDYFLNPTRGRRDSIAFEISSSEFRLRKIWLDFQQYFRTWESQIVAIELHLAAAWGINIPPTELFYLGGASTLRGYDEDWFSGTKRIHSNVEYRFLMGSNSQIFAFLDSGTVTSVERPTVFDRLRVGYGIGVRLESKSGIIQIDYGLAAGESALRGKIHVKLGAAF